MQQTLCDKFLINLYILDEAIDVFLISFTNKL